VSATELTSQVGRIVAAILNVDAARIDHSSSPDTIESWDSLRHVQLVLALEEAFGIQFTVDDIESMGTIGAVVEAVQRRRRPRDA
jgi:acyl carrier protein